MLPSVAMLVSTRLALSGTSVSPDTVRLEMTVELVVEEDDASWASASSVTVMILFPAASGLLWPIFRVLKKCALTVEQHQPSSKSATTIIINDNSRPFFLRIRQVTVPGQCRSAWAIRHSAMAPRKQRLDAMRNAKTANKRPG